MKLRYLLPLAGMLCTFLTAHAQPSPARQAFYSGSCRISPRTMLCYETPLAPLAAYLREYINVEKASDSMSADDAIVLSTDPTLGDEAFRLTVLPQRIEIAGGSYGGVFNGSQALFRLLPAEIYAKNCPLPVEIACTKVEDAPRFPYRGMMLDVARTWIDTTGVKRYIDLLSYHGINKLHLHLSDDEGWRIEIKSHPELTEIGGFRGGDSPVRPVYGKWDEKYGGYYTQDEMRGLIRYAAVRNIEIIPEIDLPGHSRNIASVHPEIRCNYPPDTVSTNGYDYRSAWCVAREENYALLTDILGELCALFPSEYIHIGGDEVDMTQWNRCPDCQALMSRQGMSDPHQLEDLFMKRMAAMGIRFRLFPPRVSYKEGAFTVTADDGSEIFYLKGDSPEEHRYTGPVRTDKPHLYRFLTRYKTGRSPYVADKSYYRTIAPAVTITTSMGESTQFPYTNASAYKGLSRTRRACRQQDWIRYTYEQPVKCREMFLQTGNRQLPKTIITTGYAEVSYDGTTYERAGDLEKGSITLKPGRPVKAVRIVSTCDDNGTPYVTIQPPQIKPVL